MSDSVVICSTQKQIKLSELVSFFWLSALIYSLLSFISISHYLHIKHKCTLTLQISCLDVLLMSCTVLIVAVCLSQSCCQLHDVSSIPARTRLCHAVFVRVWVRRARGSSSPFSLHHCNPPPLLCFTHTHTSPTSLYPNYSEAHSSDSPQCWRSRVK